jgi:hypothetical protein
VSVIRVCDRYIISIFSFSSSFKDADTVNQIIVLNDGVAADSEL